MFKNFTLLSFIFLSLTVFSQQTQPKKTDDSLLNNSNLDDQFNFVIKKSYRYKDGRNIYKVVKKEWLLSLQRHTIDSMKLLQKKIHTSLSTINTQKENIKNLNNELTSTKSNITQLNSEKNSISFFGNQMSKTAYNSMLWAIIAGLLGAMLFFIFKFNDSNTVTKSTKKSLLDIETEYEEYRRKALEREQKIMRKLQDEINKQRRES